MRRIYLALGIYSMIFFAIAAGLGLQLHSTQAETWKEWHIRAGLFVAIFICFVHSLVFIHLLGTGLGIKRAIEEHHLPEDAKAELYRFKMRSFPPAFGSMVATIVTAILGGAALQPGGSPTLHLAFAGVALVANLLTFPVVVRQLGLNEAVLRRCEQQVKERSLQPRP
jgi:FtsH-binding integral membrane protein